MTVETEAAEAARETARETVRVPANLMSLVRQSYDSREKVLDWLLAIAAAATMAYVFRGQITAFFVPTGITDPNTGNDCEPLPDTGPAALNEAFPTGTRVDLYTYNLPRSRNIRYSVGPSANGVPGNPSSNPTFP